MYRQGRGPAGNGPQAQGGQQAQGANRSQQQQQIPAATSSRTQQQHGSPGTASNTNAHDDQDRITRAPPQPLQEQNSTDANSVDENGDGGAGPAPGAPSGRSAFVSWSFARLLGLRRRCALCKTQGIKPCDRTHKGVTWKDVSTITVV